MPPATSDFEAFSHHSVLENFQKSVDALEVWEGKVFAGLGDGTLVVLESDAKAGPGAPWQVSNAYKGFAPRRILQLQVWAERKLLLCLSEEGGLNVYHLPRLALACQIGRTRNGNRFAFDAGRAMLCVAVRRKLLLLLYSPRSNEFVELKELGMPEVAVTLGWCGESVCLGFKREYAMVNANTGAMTELFSTGKPGIPVIAALRGGELLVAKDNVAVVLGSDGKPSRKSSVMWSDAPLAMTYSPPYAIALLPTCIEVRLLERVSERSLAQVIPLGDMLAVSPGRGLEGAIFTAGRTSEGAAIVHRILPKSFAAQAKALAGIGEYGDALEVVSHIPEGEAKEKVRLSNELRVLYGQSLFRSGDFEEALASFGMCSNANPLVLLRLFPCLVPPALLQPLQSTLGGKKLGEVPPEPQGDAFKRAVTMVLPYLLSHRSRLASLSVGTPTYLNMERGVSLSPQTFARGSSAEVLTLEGEGKGAQASPEGGASPSVEREQSLEQLVQLTEGEREKLTEAVDTAILKGMLELDDTGAALRFVERPNAVLLSEGKAALLARGRYSELVALYQQRGCHEEALELLRVLSQAPEELPVPPQGAAAELGGLTGTWAAVKYLTSVGADNEDLIWRHARWVLRADPEAGLQMLTGAAKPLSPSTVLPILNSEAPELSAPYLEAALSLGIASPRGFHTELALMYLRSLIAKYAAEGKENAKAEPASSPEPASAEATLQSASDPQGTASAPERGSASLSNRPDPYMRLKELVTSGEGLDAERVLQVVPAKGFLEVRALLLERLGQHQEALHVYVHELDNPRLAEAYCDRVYEAQTSRSRQRSPAGFRAEPSGRSHTTPCSKSQLGSPLNSLGQPNQGVDMYLALVQELLERGRREADDSGKPLSPGRVDTKSWGEVALLLSRKHDRIHPLNALKLLPSDVPLATVVAFLEGAVRGLGEQKRNASVVRALHRTADLAARKDLVRAQQQCGPLLLQGCC